LGCQADRKSRLSIETTNAPVLSPADSHIAPIKVAVAVTVYAVSPAEPHVASIKVTIAIAISANAIASANTPATIVIVVPNATSVAGTSGSSTVQTAIPRVVTVHEYAAFPVVCAFSTSATAPLRR
jgi:hypothetical protein